MTVLEGICIALFAGCTAYAVTFIVQVVIELWRDFR